MKFAPALISAVIAICGYIMHFNAKRITAAADDARSIKRLGRMKRNGLIIAFLGLWLLIGCVLTLIFGEHAQNELRVSVIPPRADFMVFGYQPSETMVVGWGVMAALIIGAIILRIFFIPKLTDIPGKFQNAVETIVEAVENYSSTRTTDLGRPMFGYVFAIGAMLLGNAVAELMGFRTPSSDLMFTAALSILAFIVANLYGIRKLSIKGRLKSFAKPTPLLLPIRIITELANPLSMACRLFGNTISGMIVMNLLYSVLGNFATGIPSVIGLYFNVFTALIQMVIFITLTLSSINDATTELT